MQAIDLEGQKFNLLTVIERTTNKGGATRWLCKCDCGNVTVTYGKFLKSGHTKSCGCVQEQKRREGNPKHNLVKSNNKLYWVYKSMKQRCYDKNHRAYVDYGARGIIICPKWLEDVENFVKDMQGSYEEGLSLDRIDVNGPYSPENCRWATTTEQNRNKRNNLEIRIGRKYNCVAEWCDMFGIPATNVYQRLKKNENKSFLDIVLEYTQEPLDEECDELILS